MHKRQAKEKYSGHGINMERIGFPRGIRVHTFLWVALIFALLLGPVSCARPVEIVPTSTASPVPPIATETLTPEPTATFTPTPTPVCAVTAGTLESQELATQFMPKPMRFIVYTPPCYADRTDLRYPVLYLFHGVYYDENQWVRIGAPSTADRLISSGEVPPFIIVMPFDPYPDQPYEYGFDEAFIQDLMPFIDSHYRTLPDRSHRAVGGLSRGSSWALHFGLLYPDLFGAIGMHSPIIFAQDGNVVEPWLSTIPLDKMPAIYIDIDENDQDIDKARWLENLLTSKNIPHEWHLNTGFHDEKYWSAHVEEYLRWYASNWVANP
jgi:enterochelin esterase-like enzyme